MIQTGPWGFKGCDLFITTRCPWLGSFLCKKLATRNWNGPLPSPQAELQRSSSFLEQPSCSPPAKPRLPPTVLGSSVSSAQSLHYVWLFAAPWTAACQASPCTNSRGLLKLMSIESVMPSQPFHPLSSPSPPVFNLSQHQGLFQWFWNLPPPNKSLTVSIVSPSICHEVMDQMPWS